MARYSIEIAESAQAEIRALKTADQRRVIAAIKKHLTTAPASEAGHRKVLRGLVPPWTQVRPVWQLTVVPFRVFYDVDEEEMTVYINAVRRKAPHKQTEDIL